MGTPEFAVPALKTLLEYPGAEVVGVFTQPDRPKGRGNRVVSQPQKPASLSFSRKRSGKPAWKPCVN